MNVVWTEPALDQLREIHDRLSEFSTAYGTRMVDRLTRQADQIGQFPLSGRAVPEFALRTVREVMVSPYRIIYIVGVDRIEVLAVFHGARHLA